MPVNYSSNSMSTLGCSKNASSGPDSGKLNSAYISVVSNGRSLGLLPSASTEEFESGHGNASGCFSGGCGGLGSSLSGSDQRLSVCSRMKRSMPPAFDLGKVDAVRESSFVPNSDNPSRFDYTGDYEAGGTCNAATCFPMSRIAPYIYVGSWRDAGDAELLRKHGITFILNVAEELDPASESAMIRQHDPRTIQSLSIPMKDNLHQDLGKGLTDAFAFIERARAARPPQSRDVDDGYAGGRVLVHCRRGISRSPAIVVAYLMATQGWSFRRASHYVKHRRPCISLNLAFQEKLRELRAEPKWRHASHELLSSDRSGSAPSDDDGEDEDEDERSSRSGHGGSDNEEEVDCDAPAWASRSRRDRSSHHNAHNHNHKFLCRTGENSNSKDGDVASPHTATMVGSGSTPRCFTHTNTATTDCGFDDDDGSSPFSPLVRGKPRAGGAGGGGGGKASAGFSAFGNDSSDEEE